MSCVGVVGPGLDGIVVGPLPFDGGGGAATEPTTFVYRPGGAAGGNIYDSEAAFLAAIAATDGPKIAAFDDSLGAIVMGESPADWANCVLRGAHPNGETVLVQVAEAVVWTNFRESRGNITIENVGAIGVSPVSDIVDGTTITIADVAIVRSTGAVPFFEHTIFDPGAAPFLFLANSAILGDGTNAAYKSTSPATVSTVVCGVQGEVLKDALVNQLGTAFQYFFTSDSGKIVEPQTGAVGTVFTPISAIVPRWTSRPSDVGPGGSASILFGEIIVTVPTAGGGNEATIELPEIGQGPAGGSCVVFDNGAGNTIINVKSGSSDNFAGGGGTYNLVTPGTGVLFFAQGKSKVFGQWLPIAGV